MKQNHVTTRYLERMFLPIISLLLLIGSLSCERRTKIMAPLTCGEIYPDSYDVIFDLTPAGTHSVSGAQKYSVDYEPPFGLDKLDGCCRWKATITELKFEDEVKDSTVVHVTVSPRSGSPSAAVPFTVANGKIDLTTLNTAGADFTFTPGMEIWIDIENYDNNLARVGGGLCIVVDVTGGGS